MITVQLFGATRVVVDGEERRVSGVKPRQILEILAANVGQPVAKDRLADLLWDGRPPRSYIGSLESYVCNLRRALQLGQGRGSVLRTTTGGYVLDATEVSVDLAEFRTMVADLHDTDGRQAGQLALAATRLVEGDLLASESTLLWADEERSAFSQLVTGSCLTGAAAAMKAGDAATGLALYERVLTHDQLLEAAWTGRMRALHALGRRVEALRSYGDLRRTFRRELGIAPSRETHRLYLALMDGHKQPAAEKVQMDRAELSTLLALLQDALEPMTAILGPEKVQVLSEIAADVYRTTSVGEPGLAMAVAA
jgi:DNA-binding SARP family transcriptional activator